MVTIHFITSAMKGRKIMRKLVSLITVLFILVLIGCGGTSINTSESINSETGGNIIIDKTSEDGENDDSLNDEDNTSNLSESTEDTTTAKQPANVEDILKLHTIGNPPEIEFIEIALSEVFKACEIPKLDVPIEEIELEWSTDYIEGLTNYHGVDQYNFYSIGYRNILFEHCNMNPRRPQDTYLFSMNYKEDYSYDQNNPDNTVGCTNNKVTFTEFYTFSPNLEEIYTIIRDDRNVNSYDDYNNAKTYLACYDKTLSNTIWHTQLPFNKKNKPSSNLWHNNDRILLLSCTKDKVYVVSQVPEKEDEPKEFPRYCRLSCFDANTGNMMWSKVATNQSEFIYIDSISENEGRICINGFKNYEYTVFFEKMGKARSSFDKGYISITSFFHDGYWVNTKLNGNDTQIRDEKMDLLYKINGPIQTYSDGVVITGIGTIYCTRVKDGQLLWEIKDRGITNAAPLGNYIILLSNQELLAVDVKDGTIVKTWKINNAELNRLKTTDNTIVAYSPDNSYRLLTISESTSDIFLDPEHINFPVVKEDSDWDPNKEDRAPVDEYAKEQIMTITNRTVEEIRCTLKLNNDKYTLSHTEALLQPGESTDIVITKNDIHISADANIEISYGEKTKKVKIRNGNVLRIL